MNSWTAASKFEKSELISAIDDMLQLFYIPISKSTDEQVGVVEKEISKLMLAAWDEATQGAVIKAAGAIETGPGDKPTTTEVKDILEMLHAELGAGLGTITDKKVSELVGSAYVLGKQGVSQEIKAVATLNLMDERAQQILKQDNMFWIMNHYDDQVGAKIADITHQVAIESGLGRKEVARQLKKELGAQFNQSDHYWDILGAASTHRARNLGGVAGMIDGGVKEYEILSVMDERTSDICRAMNGKVFVVAQAKKQRDAILGAKSPEEVKSIAPWHTGRKTAEGYEIRANGSGDWVKVDGLSSDKLAARGLALPPYHAFCRTTYIIKSFDDSWDVSPEPLPISYHDVTPDAGIPDAVELEFSDSEELSYLMSGQGLGGAGKKDIYIDSSGQEYIFKPALSKSGVQEDFRAYAQEAAAQIQKIVYDGGEYVDVKAMTLKGKFGTVQKKLDVTGNLAADQDFLEALNGNIHEQIQGEQVIDWLISNHDAHGGQFILTKDMKVLGIDKEQAFRYFPNDELAINYHPNKKYGEKEPIYNTLMRDWRAGAVDLNPNHILPYIQRVEAIPSHEYRNILSKYAQARFKDSNGKVKPLEVMHFLDAAEARRKNIRADFEKFYSEIMSHKLGKKYAFTFADTMPAKEFLKAPIAVQAFSEMDISKLTAAAIKELGKAKKIKYFQQMTKDELSEALVYPDKADSISEFVKQRTKAKAALARAEGPKVKEPVVKPAAGTDPFDDLSVLSDKAFGTALQKDSVIVEGQHVNIRKLFNGKTDEYQVTFKVLQDRIEAVEQKMISELKATRTNSDAFTGGNYEKGGKFVANAANGVNIRSRNFQAKTAEYTVKLYNDYNAKAYRGRITITVDGYDGKKGAKALRDILSKLGLDEVTLDPSEADEKLLKLSRLLAQNKPDLIGGLTPSDRTIDGISAILKKNGIQPDQVDSWEQKEVWPGYFAYLDKAGAERMKKLGADHLFAGISSEDGAFEFLTGGKGMMSTTERYRNGVIRNGASSSSDIRTGGAENVFTRLVPKNLVGKGRSYDDSFSGGPYTVKIKADVLARTDWYAFNSDKYGASEDYAARESRESLVKSNMANFHRGNEIMFRHGIQMDQVEHMNVKEEYNRKALIARLKAAGVTKINGVPVEDFIIVGGKM